MKKNELALLKVLVNKTMEEVEKMQIEYVLNQEKWHQGRTAEILGISPSTLYRKIKKYRLKYSK